jgi:hypothetical protein
MPVMSTPVLDVTVTTADEKSAIVKAVFDSGAYTSILREDKVPPGALVIPRTTPRTFRTAAQGGKLSATGELPVVLTIGKKMIHDVVLVAKDLSAELIIGAGLMQKWDISIVTRNGGTEVVVGRDMRDPENTYV